MIKHTPRFQMDEFKFSLDSINGNKELISDRLIVFQKNISFKRIQIILINCQLIKQPIPSKMNLIYLQSTGNHQFLGWYLDRECTIPITKITKGMTGNIIVYAKWGDKI